MADRVLCVGINDYPGRGMKLRGCRNDSRAWARTLVRQFDFARDDVSLLLDRDATARRITNGLKRLVHGAADGDRLVFTFSGHGTYVPDVDGDEVRYDEALCPYDCSDRLLVDDDLREILDDVPRRARFTFISDSCHSGSVTRALMTPTQRARFAPPAMMGRPVSPDVELAFAKRAAKPRHTRGESSMAEILLSGCRDDEYSYDEKFGHRYHGAMTFHALRALEAANWRITYADWVDDVNGRLRDDMFDQHPQLEGRSSSKQRLVFG